jgi:PKD repeat protein
MPAAACQEAWVWGLFVEDQVLATFLHAKSRLRQLLLAGLLLLLTAGCGGGGSGLVDGFNANGTATPPAREEPLEELSELVHPVRMQPQQPIELELKGVSWQSPLTVLGELEQTKETLCADSGWFIFGSEFQDELPAFNLTRSLDVGQENYGFYTPQWQPEDPVEELAVGMYLINLKHFTGEQTIKFIWKEGEAPSDYTNLYVGFGDVLGDHWDWYEGPADEVLSIESYGPYRDASGIVLIAVVLLGEEAATLERMEIGAPELRAIGDDGLGGIDAPQIPLLGDGGELPETFDLSEECAPVNDQGQWGSCTAFAVGDGAYNYELSTMYGPYGWDLSDPGNRVSPKHLYVVSGELQDFPPGGGHGRYVDQLLDGLLSNGVATEKNAPYNFVYDNNWSDEALADAELLEIDGWSEVPCSTEAGIETIKTVLARQRRPLPMRMSLDNAFFYYIPGTVYYKTGYDVGGHAMCVVGYDDSKQAFKVRNSWGQYWGENGHIWIAYQTFMDPFAYVACYTLRDDFNAEVAERFCGVENAFFPVTGVNATDGASATGVVVSWLPHEQAESYNIYRDERSNLVQTVEVPELQWIDDSAIDGYGHTYWVQAVNGTSLSPLSAPDIGYSASPPDVQAVGPLEVLEGSVVTFNAAGIGSGNLEYAWTFADAAVPNTSDEASPEVTIGAPGTYNCLVVVTNQYGGDVYPFELVVNGIKPLIDPLLNRNSGYNGDVFNISADVTGNELSYEWNFGGGASPNTSTAASPQITLAGPGRYEGSLIVSNESGSDTLLFELISIDGSNKPWREHNFNGANSNNSPRNGPADNNLAWKFFIGNRPQGSPWRLYSPVVEDSLGKIYFVADNGYLYKLNADGSFVWRFTAETGVSNTPAIGADGTIYIGAGTHLYALNPDGSQKWQSPPIGAPGLPCKIGPSGNVYCVSGDKFAYAFKPADGSFAWDPVLYATKFNIGRAIAISSEDMLFFSSDEAVFCIDGNTGAPVWTKWMTFKPQGSLALSPDERSVYMFDDGAGFYALEADCGGEIYRVTTTGSGVFGNPTLAVAADGTLFAGSRYGTLFRIDPRDGSSDWNLPMPLGEEFRVAPVLDRSGRLYWTSYDETELYCIEAGGAVEWTFTKGSRGTTYLSIGTDGTLYFGGTDGCLYSLGTNGSGETFGAPQISDVTPQAGSEGEEVTFNSTVSGSGPFTYSWDFGGGAVPNTSTSASPTVTLAAGGAYSASLVVSSTYGEANYDFELMVEAGPLEWDYHTLEASGIYPYRPVLKTIGGNLVLCYTRNDTDTIYYAYTGPSLPGQAEDWVVSGMFVNEDLPVVFDLIEYQGKPACAGQINAGLLQIGACENALPSGTDDWTLHNATSNNNSGRNTKLLLIDGKLAAVHMSLGSGPSETIHTTYANIDNPDGPEDYSTYNVATAEDFYEHFVYMLEGTPAIMRGIRLPGPWDVKLYTTNELKPDAPADWSSHEIAVVPDQSGLGLGLDSILLGGKPVASYIDQYTDATNKLKYSYTASTKPNELADWTTCLVDPVFIHEDPTAIGLVGAMPAVIYSTDGGRALRIAVAKTTSPQDDSDWTRSFIDETGFTGVSTAITNYAGGTVVAYCNLNDNSLRIAVLAP